jgi:hypothetical protein
MLIAWNTICQIKRNLYYYYKLNRITCAIGCFLFTWNAMRQIKRNQNNTSNRMSCALGRFLFMSHNTSIP